LISILYDWLSSAYRRSRPSPPPALINYVASLAPVRDCAWDCGTGNGQVAVPLASQFQRVIATDIAPKQLARAKPRSNIEYRLAPAAQSSIPDRSVDLILAGQAAHWFADDNFFSEIRRVSRPGAAVAFWCYRTPQVAPDIDELIEALYSSPRLAEHWPPGKAFVDREYRDLPFPFREIQPPQFTMVGERWAWSRFEKYIRTWPAIHSVTRTRDGSKYVKEAMAGLARVWGGRGQRRNLQWKLSLRIGFV
jgi:ubiquinone/menaquinone biosynthesis C-methylase UbiE